MANLFWQYIIIILAHSNELFGLICSDFVCLFEVIQQKLA